MLRDEIELYTKLSGNDGEHTSIGIIGAYLDGYEKGLELSENKCFDGMTNGEVIQTLFPKCIVRTDSDGWFITTIDGYTEFTPEWWNAPYKAESEKQNADSD